jgi:hypothetical protein
LTAKTLALILNHVDLLLRTGQTPLPTMMKSLLTGYAGSHNRRHRRHGHRVSSELGIDPEQVWRPGKHRLTVKARSPFCYWAVRKLGLGATELSVKFGVSQPSVSIAFKRGEKIDQAGQLKLVEK